jgi:PAS domain S-box-containing protein
MALIYHCFISHVTYPPDIGLRPNDSPDRSFRLDDRSNPSRIVRGRSESRAAMVRELLVKGGYELILGRADTEAKLAAELEAADWDVVSADYSRNRFSAPQALEVLRKRESDIPFIVISQLAGEEAAVDMMRRGAHDYLMQANITRLVPSIRREIDNGEQHRAHRRRAADLRESEDQYRDLVEHSHDLMCRHDLTGRVLYINQNAALRLGYTAEALVGRNVREALIPENSNKFDGYIEELLREGVAQGLTVVRTRAGEELVWEYTNSLRSRGDGAPVARGIAHDVTEQWKAQRALEASQSELRALFAGIDDQVFMLDSHGQCLSVAPTAFQHQGWQPTKWPARTLMRSSVRPRRITFSKIFEGRWTTKHRAGSNTGLR